MSELTQLDKTFSFIMKRMVKTGQAPFYTEIAKELGVSVEEGRKALHNVIKLAPFFSVFPNTDYVAVFPPFSNLPTQYRITIDGKQKWFGQCGFESLAVTWLFPRETVQIDAPCLDCREPIQVKMKDGVVQSAPKELVGYTSVPLREWSTDFPFA